MQNPLSLLLSVLWVVLTLDVHVMAHGNSSEVHHKYLKTSSLLTCMNNSQFSASYFDVRYYPFNETFVFKIDAMTAISGNVTLKAEVITYGITVVQKEFDLCSLNEATLCPLSAGRVDVGSTYQLKNSDLTKSLPNVAYTIPDLDAQVRVLAYKKGDSSSGPVACVQAFLSNDKTVQTRYAAWPIAAVSGVGVLTSGFVSVIGYSTTAAHIASNSISLFIYFQNLAITAMMGVSRVPPIAAAWTQNFQWSMGIIRVEFMQKIFNWYVQATKGMSTVVLSNKDILSISVQKRDKFKRGLKLASSDDYGFDSMLKDSSLYTTNERNTTAYSSKILVLRGMERVAYDASIELSNFFLTGVVFFLFFVFAMTVGMLFFKALLELLTRAKIMAESSNFFLYRKNWGSIIKGTLFRIAIIAFPQISLLSMWEFTQRDSPAVVVDAVVMLLVVTGILLYGTMRVFFKGRLSERLYKNPAYLLFGDIHFLNRYGFLYTQFRADKYWWLLPLLFYGFLRSLFVAVLQSYGKTQAIIVFVIELAYFVSLCWIRPYLDTRTNIFNIAIHLVTLINALFFLFFSNLFKQPAVVSSVMAVILFVLNAVFALFLLLFTLVTCTLALLRKNPDARYQPLKDDRVSFIPKIQGLNGSSLLLEGRTDSDSELFELRKAAMDTNETEQEKNLREDIFNNNKLGGRVLFDDELSTLSSSTPAHFSNRNRSPSDLPPEPVQPNSAVLGFDSAPSSSSHPRVLTPSAHQNSSANDLLKPETSFYSHPYHSSSNPYL
ncbi:flavin adenine dinucleotide transporter flc2 [Zygosaccharomyces mellis]|uniref:Flavin adenine dinucleotide transporter flc2 n=1 Tax=Zygosaccharomyces mellis TaxID=42258 RepID=A0A4C2E6Z2_9SACH|nr:flavin adenine dinucleotide transporter flc2 [Zygosaccharomyces mellis]